MGFTLAAIPGEGPWPVWVLGAIVCAALAYFRVRRRKAYAESMKSVEPADRAEPFA